MIEIDLWDNDIKPDEPYKCMKQFSSPNNNLELLPRFTDAESKTQGSK